MSTVLCKLLEVQEHLFRLLEYPSVVRLSPVNLKITLFGPTIG
jgi:hypothetical protein